MALQNVKGEVRLWANVSKSKDGESIILYSITIGNKQKDGTYINAKLPVSFSKKANEKLDKIKDPNGLNIDLVEAWLSNYTAEFTNKEGKLIKFGKIILFVNDFDVVGFSTKAK